MADKKSLYCGVIFAAFALAGNLQATLGEALKPNIMAKAQPRAGYFLREYNRDGGGKMREYAGRDGVVFGVSWEGGRLPDFENILGEQYKVFLQEVQLSKQRRGPLFIDVGDLTVVSGGHQRDFRGRAYFKSRIPSHLSHEVVR